MPQKTTKATAIHKTAPKKTIREIRIDRKTIRRIVVDVEPSTCEVCGYDVIRSNHGKFLVDSYDELDAEGKLVIRQVLKKHRAIHSAAEAAAAAAVSETLK